VRFGTLLEAGLNVVPPALFVLGLGTLVFGFRPRLTSAAVYGYLAWAILLEFIGGPLKASHWLMDTSVLFHMLPAPAVDPDWIGAAVLTALGAGLAVLGAVLFDRRDTTGS
jgi:ABC-2 type transport system permease protein